MKRIDALGSRSGNRQANYGAVLSASLIQLEAGDYLCCAPELLALITSLKSAGKQSESLSAEGAVSTRPGKHGSLSPACVVISAGLKALSENNANIVIAAAGSLEGWEPALTKAQDDRLPLVFVVTDQPSTRKQTMPDQLTWPSMTKMAKKLHVPTVSVDGEDAVALYRVIQECLHRAKHGDGPAIIWCSFPLGGRSTVSTRSIANMENYLAVRGLGPKARKPAAKA